MSRRQADQQPYGVAADASAEVENAAPPGSAFAVSSSLAVRRDSGVIVPQLSFGGSESVKQPIHEVRILAGDVGRFADVLCEIVQ